LPLGPAQETEAATASGSARERNSFTGVAN
jgi:hypothetical protein